MGGVTNIGATSFFNAVVIRSNLYGEPQDGVTVVPFPLLLKRVFRLQAYSYYITLSLYLCPMCRFVACCSIERNKDDSVHGSTPFSTGAFVNSSLATLESHSVSKNLMFGGSDGMTSFEVRTSRHSYYRVSTPTDPPFFGRSSKVVLSCLIATRENSPLRV